MKIVAQIGAKRQKIVVRTGHRSLAAADTAALQNRESGHRYLMRALARTGNTAEALRVYERLRTNLRDELGIAPSAETLELHSQLLRGAAHTIG